MQGGNNSRVKVGVRIRPLLAKERHLQSIIQSRSDDSVECKLQTFTYDFVFGTDLSQHDLYSKTAAPMLKNFLEGYNVTIMAYGQTGSGKTFTMGTSDLISVDDVSMQGLIPRFVTDLFENMKQCGEGERLESKIKVSFCEIYGEDVFDLINPSTNMKQGSERPSLAVREDENGHVFVQGQSEMEVSSANEALDFLCLGSRNRITGSTAMNAGSSRSHAVFTITLDQTLQTSGTDIVQEDTHYMSSKLTFVDLAGSERIKRTGAEGQRLKEGIQINSGLFNLGQVINALADDQKIKQGLKPAHVPYRNSKLTHLLKDALGGNSQTLFLACVSPAESNESETLSTLVYARQARNIQNKPVRNTDKTQQELRYLKYSVKTWMMKAITHIFTDRVKRLSIAEPMTPLPNESSPVKSDDIFQRPDVQDYIQSINKAIQEKIQGANPTPRKVRLSVIGPFLSPQRPNKGLKIMQELNMNDADHHDGNRMLDSIEPFSHRGGGRESILFAGNIQHAYEVPDPEETEKLVSRMLEMVTKEKDLSNFEADGETEVAEMEQQIEEKEKILSTLLETVKGYSAMKSDFEKLLGAIETLEAERKELEIELEKAKKVSDSKIGGSVTNNPAVERIQERFKKVQDELKQMREERKCKENAYRLMQRESKQAESLQKELAKLKDAKVALLKQQKSQAAQFQKLKKDHNNKLAAIKKTDIKKQRQMNTLKSEIVKKDRVLGHKDRELNRINSKLRACEDHITQLLKIQNRNRQKVLAKTDDKSSLPNEEQEHFISSKIMLDNLVHDRVDAKRAKVLCDMKSKVLRDLNKELVQEACEMEMLLSKEKLLRGNKESEDGDDIDDEEEMTLACKTELLEVREAIRSVENNIDRITRELDIYNADLDELSNRIDDNSSKEAKQRLCWDDLCKEIIAGFSIGQFQHLVWDLLKEKAEAMEEHFIASDALTQATSDCENAREKIQELEKQLTQTRVDMKIRLEKAEAQRVQDIWSLLKAQNATNSSNITSSEDSDVSIKVSIQRAQELEQEVESLVANEEKLRDDNAELKQQLIYLQNEAYMEKARLRLDEVISEVPEDQCFQVLGDVWSNLGLSHKERDDVIDSITKASSLAKVKAQADAIHALEKAKVDVKTADQTLVHLCTAMDVPTTKYFNNHKKSMEAPLLEQLEMLTAAIESAKEEFQTKVNQVINMKERLLDLVSEMWLEMGELPTCLQVLMNISGADNDTITFASELFKSSTVLSDSTMASWEKEMRQLNLTRATITNKLVALREDIVSRGSVLGLFDKNYLHEIIAPNTLGSEITSDAVKAVVPLLLSTSNSNPPASTQLLAAMERVKVIFESIKANRVTVSSSLINLVENLNGMFTDEKVLAVLDNTENPPKDWLLSAFDVIGAFSSRATQAKSKYSNQLIEMMEEANCGAPEEREASVQELIASTNEFLSSSSFQTVNQEFVKLDESIDDLTSMSIFFEEPWLCSGIKKLSKAWNEKLGNNSVRDVIQQVLLLRSEANRVQGLVEAIRDVKKLDSQLTKHVIDMEEFEIVSKQNRSALLSGNSKALVEEEKFRKNGKLKYESLSKKILAAVEKANNLANCGNKCISIPLDLSFVGTQTQLLLKGFKNERLELMHLHTTTHGTKRWSGEIDDNDREKDEKVSEISEAVPVKVNKNEKKEVNKGAEKKTVNKFGFKKVSVTDENKLNNY